MNSLRFCLFIVIVLVIDGISHGRGQLTARRNEQDIKNKLLKLLLPSETPEVVEDPSIELRESNLIDTLQYLPIYKDPQVGSNNFESPTNNNMTNKNNNKRDGKFTRNPWLTFNPNNRGPNIIFRTSNDDNFESFSYESESTEEPSNFHRHNPQFHPGHEQKHGFYHYHYHHHHPQGHYNAEHNPECFPHRRRPPPRPRPTGPPPTASTDSVNPRASTVAGFRATQVPQIDIRGLF